MTKNQIEFAKYLETQRTNLENESLNRKRNEAAAKLGLDQLAETQRHNKEVEMQAHHTNAIAADNLAETQRHNYVAERENQRSNVAKEGISRYEAEVQQQNADTRRLEQLESSRHNAASEYETASHNRATESQQRNELGQKYADLAMRTAQAAAEISLKRDSLSETTRSNKAQEALSGERNRETFRHNAVGEGQTALRDYKNDLNTRVGLQQNQQKIDMDVSLLPYKKANSVSDTVNKFAGSLEHVTQSLSNVANSFSRATQGARTLRSMM